jgi:glycosyltransferase involved in cell wall biosynthesis
VRARVSIGIPQLSGGGAEKISLHLAARLAAEDRLSRIYTGTGAGAEAFPDLDIVPLGAQRALGAAAGLARASGSDPARTFLLTLGYVNLAPVLRLRRPRSRIVIRIGSIVSTESSYRSRASRLRYLAALRLACLSADVIVAQGTYMAEDLAAHVPAARRKLRVIHNFVEPELWDFVPSKRPLRAPYLFCAASFKPEKAFDVLLDAYGRSPARANRKLVVAGVAPDDAAFRALMAAKGLEDEEVVRLGYVPAPYNWAAHADLCVLASRFEGFSNFLLESAALGKRIAATGCPGGNAELFSHYDNAVVVPVNDAAALAAALSSPRRDLPRSAARSALARFEYDGIYENYLSALFGEPGSI